jgi:hypothetical protein
MKLFKFYNMQDFKEDMTALLYCFGIGIGAMILAMGIKFLFNF